MAETISQLEASGFTHLMLACDNPDCRPAVMREMSFARIRELKPRWMVSAMTLEDLQAKMPCKRCGSRTIDMTPVDRRTETARLSAHSYPDYSRRG
jgi:hypothetical protein